MVNSPTAIGNQFIGDYPAVPKALLSDPPQEIIKELATSPALAPVKEATIRLAQLKRQRDLEESRKIIIENRTREWKSVNGLGELKARIPLSVYFEMRRREGDDYWEHNTEEFLNNNPQYKIKITRNTKGNEY